MEGGLFEMLACQHCTSLITLRKRSLNLCSCRLILSRRLRRCTRMHNSISLPSNIIFSIDVVDTTVVARETTTITQWKARLRFDLALSRLLRRPVRYLHSYLWSGKSPRRFRLYYSITRKAARQFSMVVVSTCCPRQPGTASPRSGTITSRAVPVNTSNITL
jgi:hypothetical protein